MKLMLSVSAVLALSATTAFAQGPQGSSVYFQSASGATAETAGLIDLIKRALEKSRSLQQVPVSDEDALELEAPVSFVKEADGKRITVTYDVAPPGGNGSRTYTTTCAATQMDRCADAIVLRTERIARESKFAPSMGGMIP